MKRRIILITIIGILMLAVYSTAGAETIFSGTCGENITFALDDTGLMEITGTGPITSHEWTYYQNRVITIEITRVVISDGITEIPEYAFEECTNLESVTIPDSVQSIGKYAFYQCLKLSDARIPDGITTIEEGIFCGCRRLESITIPESVRYIEAGAFAVSGLKEITLPANLKRLGASAFYECSELAGDIILPAGLEELGNTCFGSTPKLKSITVPDNTRIESSAIWPGKCFTHIGSIASKTLCIHNHDKCWSEFYDPRYPEYRLGYRSEYTEDGDEILTDLEITGVDQGTTTVVIPNGVTRVAAEAFKLNNEIRKVVFPDSVTSIGEGAFYMSTYISHFEFPKNLKSIEKGAFINCSFLVNPIFPDSLEYIGEYAFASCYNIENLTFPKKIKAIEANAFQNLAALKSVTLPEGLEKIGPMAFYSCGELSEIFIPDSVTEVAEDAFDHYQFIIYANRNTKGAKSVSKAGYSFREPRTKFDMRYLYEGNRITGLMVTGADKSITSLTLPPEVTAIDKEAFYACKKLNSITIQDKVTLIDDSAFGFCTKLTRISFLEKKSTQVTICDTAFEGGPDPEVYCYANSSAEYFATRKGWNVHRLDGDVTIQKLKLEDNFGLAAGSSRELVVDVFPSNAEISWSSSNTDAVTVQNGVVTAYAPGRAVITAMAGDKTDTVTITVYNPAESFELEATETWTVAFNEPVCRSVNVEPSNATMNLKWFSDDTTIATVENGVVKTLYPGDVVISATDSFTGTTASILLHVCYPVSRIDLSADPAKILPGQTADVTANVTMRKTSCVNHLVTFSSSNTAVATVNQQGKVTAKAPGYVTITARAIPFSDIYPERPEPASITIEVLEGCCVLDGIVYGHDWSETEYEWLDNNTKVKATRVCSRNPRHIETETVTAGSRITRQPTCTEKGETTYTSAAFRNINFEIQEKTEANIQETGHDWGETVYEWNSDHTQVTATRICRHNTKHKETETAAVAGSEVTKEADCTTEGETTYTSAAFENTAFMVQHITLTDIPALGHDEVIDIPAKEPTCTETGTTTGSHCERCGSVLKEAETIPMIPHVKEVDKEAKAPTCTETGWTEAAHCSKCGTVLSESEEVAMVPHVKEVDKEAKAATCTEPGCTEGAHCATCGTVLSVSEEIGPTGHQWGTPHYLWAKDYSTCKAEQVCEHDKTHIRREDGTVSSETTPATEEADGLAVYKAEFTDEAFEDQTVEVIIPKLPPPKPPTPVSGNSEYKDPKGTGWYFIHKEGPATYMRPVKSQATVKIPDSIQVNGKSVKVTSIWENAFKNDKKLTTITIGANVTAIGENAFASCKKLKTVKGGKYVAKIKDGAFSGCKALAKFPVMDKLQTIGANAFKDCVKLKQFTLGKNVKEIGKSAFLNCKALKNITVKTTKLNGSKVKKDALKGINSKAVFKCPKNKAKEYLKLFIKKGAPKTVKAK